MPPTARATRCRSETRLLTALRRDISCRWRMESALGGGNVVAPDADSCRAHRRHLTRDTCCAGTHMDVRRVSEPHAGRHSKLYYTECLEYARRTMMYRMPRYLIVCTCYNTATYNMCVSIVEHSQMHSIRVSSSMRVYARVRVCIGYIRLPTEVRRAGPRLRMSAPPREGTPIRSASQTCTRARASTRALTAIANEGRYGGMEGYVGVHTGMPGVVAGMYGDMHGVTDGTRGVATCEDPGNAPYVPPARRAKAPHTTSARAHPISPLCALPA